MKVQMCLTNSFVFVHTLENEKSWEYFYKLYKFQGVTLVSRE